LPIPATFVIDRDGTVLFASANEDYMERPEPLEILPVLETEPDLKIKLGSREKISDQ
jgi:peroxiredoxin